MEAPKLGRIAHTPGKWWCMWDDRVAFDDAVRTSHCNIGRISAAKLLVRSRDYRAPFAFPCTQRRYKSGIGIDTRSMTFDECMSLVI